MLWYEAKMECEYRGATLGKLGEMKKICGSVKFQKITKF